MRYRYVVIQGACCFLLLSIMLLVTTFSQGSMSALADSPSFVRIVHASPDVGTADVFLDGKKVLSDFGFGTVTGYVTIPSGPHKVQIALIGKGIGASVITQTLTVAPGVAYTVAAMGAKPSDLGLEAFVDDNQLTAGLTKLRFYHLSPGTGSVNVSANGHVVIQGLSYQAASDYVSIKPGSYTFNVDLNSPNSKVPITATLKANTVTSEFAVGLLSGTPKIEFVSSLASGVPGMPGTGSDPHAIVAPKTAAPSSFGLWQVLALLVVSSMLLLFRPLTRSHRWLRKPAREK